MNWSKYQKYGTAVGYAFGPIFVVSSFLLAMGFLYMSIAGYVLSVISIATMFFFDKMVGKEKSRALYEEHIKKRQDFEEELADIAERESNEETVTDIAELDKELKRLLELYGQDIKGPNGKRAIL